MNDLNQLSDAELSAVFAVEVAGEELRKCAFASADGGKSGALFEDIYTNWGDVTRREDVERFCDEHPDYKVCFQSWPSKSFATSMDAVLPYLERTLFRIERLCQPDEYCVYIELPKGTYVKGCDERLSKAACIALILAKRAEKEAAK